MAEDLTQSITDNAKAPRRAEGDAGSVEQHPLPEQIAADRYVKSAAAAKKGRGFRLTRMVPGGTV